MRLVHESTLYQTAVKSREGLEIRMSFHGLVPVRPISSDLVMPFPKNRSLVS
jgi:hypothetical protein